MTTNLLVCLFVMTVPALSALSVAHPDRDMLGFVDTPLARSAAPDADSVTAPIRLAGNTANPRVTVCEE